MRILSRADVKSEHGLSRIISENILVAKVHDGEPHYLPTGGKAPIDYPFFNGSHIITASSVSTRLSYEPQPYLLVFPEDAIKQSAYKTYNGTHHVISLVTKGGRFLMFVPTIPEQLTLNGFEIPWRWAKFSAIEFEIPPSAKPVEQKITVRFTAFPETRTETKTYTVTETITSAETVTTYVTKTFTLTSAETIIIHATETVTEKIHDVLPEQTIPISYMLLVTITAATSFAVFALLMKRKIRRR